MSIQEYLDKHTLSRKIEDAVNAAVRAKAPDPVLFISNHMRKPVRCVITNIKARQILDGRGIFTVEVETKDSYLGRLIPIVTLSVS
ncbi:cytosolic enolase [Thalictrum thalictroides]|uniref:Cytosolic enolase n=1 Tax=Thalictrum thalictroides TaxID=46969 RepID=A0A7J6VK98_THATH|nr:cytosolic enolase [Thalictrum thalictroides]